MKEIPTHPSASVKEGYCMMDMYQNDTFEGHQYLTANPAWHLGKTVFSKFVNNETSSVGQSIAFFRGRFPN